MNIQGVWFGLARNSPVGFAMFQLSKESPDCCRL